MRARWICCLPLFACAACITPISQPGESSAVPAAPARVDVKAFVDAETSEELANLVQRALDERDYDGAFTGLKKFTEANVLTGHEARGGALLHAVRPVWRFQTSGGQQYMGGLEQLQIILDNGARGEVGRAYSAVERNDVDTLRRIAGDPRSFMSAEVRPLSSQFAPHAAFFSAFLRYDDLRHANPPGAAEARAIAADLEGCCAGLEHDKYDEAAFFARIVAAQALDLAGLGDEAIERWIAVGKCTQLAKADESVQLAVAGKIQSYRDRLRSEVAGAVHAEEQARADAAIKEAEAHASQLSEEQRARISALQSELERVGAEHAAETGAQLAMQGAVFQGTVDQQAQRIRELEQLFVQIAVAQPHDWRAKDEALVQQTSVVSVLSDLTSTFQASRFRAERSLGEPQ